MKRAISRRQSAGLTLIELMVALAVFAVLGVLSFRALSAASNSQARLDENFLRWTALARSMNRIETELFEVVSRQADPGSPLGAALQLTPAAAGSGGELDFLRLDAGHGVRRVGFRRREQKLEWLLWEGREAVGSPQVEILLDNVQDLRWHFIADGQRQDVWPPDAARRGSLPAAVIVEIDLPELGSFQRIFALH